METPKTQAGNLTERIMFQVTERVKDQQLTTFQYNRIYEVVLEALEEARP